MIDTAVDLVRVLNEVIAQDGLGETDYEAARRQIGMGSRALITDAYKRAGAALSSARLDDLQKQFLEIYAQGSSRYSRPFDGVEATLRGLIRQGHDLSVCTNKPGYLARPLITALSMDDYFSVVIGGDDMTFNKPWPDHIFACAGHDDPERIVMVGDGMPDTLSAKAAGVPCIVMRYGYSTVPFYRLGGNVMLSRFSQLPSALVGLTR